MGVAVKPIVILVDDETDSREMLRDILDIEGYAVEQAANGNEALACLKEVGASACVMLLDLYMPVMNGWEVLEHIRQQDNMPNLRIFVTTSAPEKAPTGIPVFIKPLDVGQVLATLKALSYPSA